MECQRCHTSDDNKGLSLVQIIFPPNSGVQTFNWLFCVKCCKQVMTFVSKDNFTPDDIIEILTNDCEGDKLRNTDYIR